jgi:hypothetical protein
LTSKFQENSPQTWRTERKGKGYIISFSTPHGAGFKTFSPKLFPPSALLHPKPPLPLRPTSRSFWIHFLVQMEQLDSKFHQKYTALKVPQASRFFLLLFL